MPYREASLRECIAYTTGMGKHGDKKVVVAALVGNGAITVLKFVVAFTSASAAMLAEAFHSAADTGNQVLLLIGLSRSRRPPDEEHPFGYGKEVYFWSFVVAVSIFFVGAALSIYEGIHRILHPEPVESILMPLLVLAAAMLFEAYSFSIALSEARSLKRKSGLGGYIDMAVRTKNPTVMVVLFEDSVALLGLVVASIGISASYLLKVPVIDGVTSIVIGLLLLCVALFLAIETKKLLIGESATKDDRKKMREALKSIEEVCECGKLMTMHLGPNEILLNLDVKFKEGLTTNEVELTVERVESEIKKAVPAVSRVFIEAQSFKSGCSGTTGK